ncbi:MAG: SelD-related putative sulfur metabolism protein [Nitrososphaerales archaeon]
METTEEFWERVSRYREMGMDPLRWVAGCAVKVDLTTVVYPALRRLRPLLRELGVIVAEREDADIFTAGREEPTISRRIYNLRDPKIDREDLKRINPKRAISLVQVHQRGAETDKIFGDILLSLYNSIALAEQTFIVGKGHSIITGYEDAEFALFDFISGSEAAKGEGFTLANNDTIQVIDPTADPGSKEQTDVAVSNSLNDLIALGCYEGLRLLPVIDAPNEELEKRIFGNMEKYARKYGIRLLDADSPGRRKLLIGATFIGKTSKEPPVRPDLLTEGMKILITRPFGDLAPINVYLSCLADEDFLKKLEENDTLKAVEIAKNRVIETMREPNLGIGKIVNQFLPDQDEEFITSEHLVATGDMSGPGVLIFKEIAEKTKVDISLDELPVKYADYVRFATENFLMDNATSGTNGAVALIGEEGLISEIMRKLKREGHDPRIIGTVTGKGDGRLETGDVVNEMIASAQLLSEVEIRKG